MRLTAMCYCTFYFIFAGFMLGKNDFDKKKLGVILESTMLGMSFSSMWPPFVCYVVLANSISHRTMTSIIAVVLFIKVPRSLRVVVSCPYLMKFTFVGVA